MPAQAIQALDKLIDANRDALIKAFGREPEGAAGWQEAWDAHPALHARDCELFRQRGVAQVERDHGAAKEAAREQRAARMKAARERKAARAKPVQQCPTCGCHTLRAA